MIEDRIDIRSNSYYYMPIQGWVLHMYIRNGVFYGLFVSGSRPIPAMLRLSEMKYFPSFSLACEWVSRGLITILGGNNQELENYLNEISLNFGQQMANQLKH